MTTQTMALDPVLDAKEIRKILPHRYPFLLVDKIVELDLEKAHIVGQKNLTINEAFFQGHFPDTPIMPGVLILEALAQTGGVLCHLMQNLNKIAVLLSVKNAKFRHPVRPGDILYLHVKGLFFSSNGAKIKALAKVHDKIACEAEIGYAFINKDQI